MQLSRRVQLIVLCLPLVFGHSAAFGSPDAPASAAAAGGKTAKERLVNKAADEQRVNNCRVPPALQGQTPRPGCPDSAADQGAAQRGTSLR